MNKTEKFLRRLSQKERLIVEEIIEKVGKGNTSELDMKKLKGQSGLFRVRHGVIRVIFQKIEDTLVVISIDRRREDTYKF
ncbi:MAG: hypothetical protein HYY92_03770 [Parcubacteria group bacterium]|nr:hypothetical protein [Parcubacteria group bacterium]